MTFIPTGANNPLNNPDDHARVLNILVEQLCILRADVVALQGALLQLGEKQGVTVQELISKRIALRNDSFETICKDVMVKIARAPSSDSPQP